LQKNYKTYVAHILNPVAMAPGGGFTVRVFGWRVHTYQFKLTPLQNILLVANSSSGLPTNLCSRPTPDFQKLLVQWIHSFIHLFNHSSKNWFTWCNVKLTAWTSNNIKQKDGIHGTGHKRFVMCGERGRDSFW